MEAKDLLPNEPTELGSPQPTDISWFFMSGGKICTFGIVKKDQKLHQNCAADGIFTSREFRLETRIIRVFLGFSPGYARLNRASVVVSVMVQAGGKILRQVP